MGRSILVWTSPNPAGPIVLLQSLYRIPTKALGRDTGKGKNKSRWCLQLCFNVQLPCVPSGWSPPFPPPQKPPPPGFVQRVSGSTPKAGGSKGHSGRGPYRVKWASPGKPSFGHPASSPSKMHRLPMISPIRSQMPKGGGHDFGPGLQLAFQVRVLPVLFSPLLFPALGHQGSHLLPV